MASHTKPPRLSSLRAAARPCRAGGASREVKPAALSAKREASRWRSFKYEDPKSRRVRRLLHLVTRKCEIQDVVSQTLKR